MHHELREFADADQVAAAAAAFIAERARDVVRSHGVFHLAVSGGRTPRAMFVELATREVPWERCVVHQVDERVAPLGDEHRNLTQLTEALAPTGAVIEAMPVNNEDLGAAAARYGERLPVRFDLVHLGLGPDGHTASLVPGDAVLTDVRPVALTGLYQGFRRMTLTYSALARADQLLWLVTGEDKRDALRNLLDGATNEPAGRVVAARSTIMADRAATS